MKNIENKIEANANETKAAAFQKKTREYASQYVVRSIQDGIHTGQLQIGDALPSEMELAEQLGVGRSSVREGIRILETIGILEVKHGKGTYVADNFVESLFKMMGFSMLSDNLGDFLAVRRVLECGSVQLQDPLSAEDVDELEALAKALSPENSLKDNIVYDRLFHNKLIRHTGNIMMIRIYDMVEGLLKELLENLMSYEDVVKEVRKAHLKIVEGLRTNNPHAVERAMSEHLASVEEYADKRIMKTSRRSAVIAGHKNK